MSDFFPFLVKTDDAEEEWCEYRLTGYPGLQVSANAEYTGLRVQLVISGNVGCILWPGSWHGRPSPASRITQQRNSCGR